MNTIVETHRLTKLYNGKPAVDNLDLRVRKGEVYGFLGLNGAGKTTTIRMILGLCAPESGFVELFGRDMGRCRMDILPRIGSIIETPGFYENLTGKENLLLLYGLLGLTDRAAPDAALKTAGLLEEADKKVKEYSLGMKQRLGIAAAVMHNPELLILDEPTNGLDPMGIIEIRNLIRTMAGEKGMTVFVSSHILSEVQQIADRVGIIHEGRLVREISMRELAALNRKYLEITVSDPAKTLFLLENDFKISDFEAYPDNRVRVYTAFEQAADINAALVRSGVAVSGLHVSKDSLEDFFMKHTGGANVETA